MKKSLRVNLTFSETSQPEWFAYLSKIHSGHVRAELVRAHLKPPGEVNPFAPEKDQPPIERHPSSTDQTTRPNNTTSDAPTSSEKHAGNHMEASTESLSGDGAPHMIEDNNGETLANILIKSGSAQRW